MQCICWPPSYKQWWPSSLALIHCVCHSVASVSYDVIILFFSHKRIHRLSGDLMCFGNMANDSESNDSMQRDILLKSYPRQAANMHLLIASINWFDIIAPEIRSTLLQQQNYAAQRHTDQAKSTRTVRCKPIETVWRTWISTLSTETKMSSFWRNFHHWLHWKLSFWQLPVQPVMKISSKRQHFRFSDHLTCGNKVQWSFKQMILQMSSS